MGGANVSPWVASAKESRTLERAVLSWHWGRDIHTTVFNDCAGVQAIRAHLRRAACPFDLWILQMKSRGETETNHLRFWKSFRTDWLSKTDRGWKRFDLLRDLLLQIPYQSFSLWVCVCGVKKKERVAWVSQKTNWREFFQTGRNATVKQCKHEASNMCTVAITELPGTVAVLGQWRIMAFVCSIN